MCRGRAMCQDRASDLSLRRAVALAPNRGRHGVIVWIGCRRANSTVGPGAQVFERVEHAAAHLPVGGAGSIGAMLFERARGEADIMGGILGATIAGVLDEIGQGACPRIGVRTARGWGKRLIRCGLGVRPWAGERKGVGW